MADDITPRRLGLIAGSGDLPALLLEAALAQGREVVVLALGDSGFRIQDSDSIRILPLPLSELPNVLDILRAEGVTDVVMAGGIKRPPLKAFKPSPFTAKLLARIGKAFFGGDDALLKAVVSIFEEEGFHVIGADELLGELLTPAGVLTTTQPSAEALADIAFGITALQDYGKQDKGQALLVCHGKVLAVEDERGTDALIVRGVHLSHWERSKDAQQLLGEGKNTATLSPDSQARRPLPMGEVYRGVLVKGRKPNQERRVDLPSFGAETIRNLHAAGFAGIAIEAGGSLLIHREATLALANRLGLFIVGFDVDQPA